MFRQVRCQKGKKFIFRLRYVPDILQMFMSSLEPVSATTAVPPSKRPAEVNEVPILVVAPVGNILTLWLPWGSDCNYERKITGDCIHKKLVEVYVSVPFSQKHNYSPRKNDLTSSFFADDLFLLMVDVRLPNHCLQQTHLRRILWNVSVLISHQLVNNQYRLELPN